MRKSIHAGAFSAREVETTTSRFSTFCEDGMGAHSRKADRKRRLIPSRKFTPPARHVASLVIPVAAKDRLAFSSRIGDPPPSFTPRLRCGQSGLSVRGDHRALFLSERSNRCGTNGSTSEPSSATKNGTRWAMRPEMKCTSRDSRSNLPRVPSNAFAQSLTTVVRGARIPGCVVHAILTFLLKNVVSRGGGTECYETGDDELSGCSRKVGC